jgi:acetyl-CoA carboxylase carboxyltransferase component
MAVKKKRASITFFRILKEIELACLKYVAIDEGYLIDEVVDIYSTKAALKRALKAMQT